MRDISALSLGDVERRMAAGSLPCFLRLMRRTPCDTLTAVFTKYETAVLLRMFLRVDFISLFWKSYILRSISIQLLEKAVFVFSIHIESIFEKKKCHVLPFSSYSSSSSVYF